MKLTRNQLKELVRQSISELDMKKAKANIRKTDLYKSYGDFMPGLKDDTDEAVAKVASKVFPTIKQMAKKAAKNPKIKKAAVAGAGEYVRKKVKKEGGPGSGRKKDDDGFDVGGPAYPNVPKGAKTSKQAKKMLKKKKVKESVKKSIKTTVKEVKQWMKTLEENRYRKLVNADCRRVSWLVNNNLAEDYDQMPISMQKKWPKAQYGKERYLAKEFIKHKKAEQKLRESIKRIVERLI
tara:strand:+ start:4147 stop:4857 length:711 start_codon:yes stop_codon:yes gene_type:complete